MSSKVNSGKSRTKVLFREINFSWVIDGFSLLDKKTGELMTSQKFPKLDDDKCEWRLRLYPMGLNEQSKDYISVFLFCILNETNAATAHFSFSFRDKNDKIIMSKKNLVKEFSNTDGGCWGKRYIIKRNELLPLLIDDVLVFDCTVKWKVDIIENYNETAPLAKPNVQENLSNDLYKLINEGPLSDVSLLAKNGTKFPAHKCLLAARSPVFAAMFAHNTRERRESIIKINDIDADVLKLLLQFMYTSKVDLENCEVEGLLAAADKYGIEDLKVLCELELNKQLNIENVINLLLLADLHNAQTLKTEALKLISKNLKDVLKTQAMKNLTITQTSLFYDILEAVAD